jgi:hypothetical protein
MWATLRRTELAFLWCWWASFNEDEGEEGKKRSEKEESID